MRKTKPYPEKAIPVGIRALHRIQKDPPRDALTYNQALERDVTGILDELVAQGFTIVAPS